MYYGTTFIFEEYQVKLENSLAKPNSIKIHKRTCAHTFSIHLLPQFIGCSMRHTQLHLVSEISNLFQITLLYHFIKNFHVFVGHLTHVSFDRVSFPTAVFLVTSLLHWSEIPLQILTMWFSLEGRSQYDSLFHQNQHDRRAREREYASKIEVPIFYYLVLNVTQHHFCCQKQTT